MDLDGFTSAQLEAMHKAAAATAIAHYEHAQQITRDSAAIPYTDTTAYDASCVAWRAAMAAGNEQEELTRAIGKELDQRRMIRNA